jgi:two-component system, NtrC family, sensor kinase
MQLVRTRIRSLMYLGVALLFLIVAVLSIASVQGVLKFRKLSKNIRGRATELPLAADLSNEISRLRSSFFKCSAFHYGARERTPFATADFPRFQFKSNLVAVESALGDYEEQLVNSDTSDPRIADTTRERQVVSRLRQSLKQIYLLIELREWDFGSVQHAAELEQELDSLQAETNRLPTLMKERMDAFADEARGEYHGLLLLSGVMTLLAMGLLGYLMLVFRRRIFDPLGQLVEGSRQVAGGNYDHRTVLATNDEMSELADSFNAMTANFQAIQQDLNGQVQQRTREVVRSEQMASVGFLAAGVAHEINNPLATIAWSAESLEGRLDDILDPAAEKAPEQRQAEIDQMRKYLRRIQDEAFRCKGITGGLLDFSRLGDAKKVPTQLQELIQSVIDMVRTLGKYRRRKIEFEPGKPLTIAVNPQEMKQVVLNLITNALDSMDDGGTVRVSLTSTTQQVALVVRDDGCGMSEEVMQHLFEPFYTRRRDGQGTGLGLSITYRIIEEHGGRIEPFSEGPGKGSTFTITLPLKAHDQKHPTGLAA